MFPAIRVKVSGLDPKSYYMLMMDVVPLDNKRYRWEIAARASQLKKNYIEMTTENEFCAWQLAWFSDGPGSLVSRTLSLDRLWIRLPASGSLAEV